jgi:hypothetical protein
MNAMKLGFAYEISRSMWLVLAMNVWLALGECLAQNGQQNGQRSEPRIRYEGAIGKASIRMTLQQKDDVLLGTYQYTKVGKDLQLFSTLAGKDSVVLKEFDEQDRQTGLFRGRYVGTPTKTDAIAGVWSRPDGSKPVAFTLRAVGAVAPPTPVDVDVYTGRYKRSGKHSAELNVRLLSDGRLKIEGEAFWVGSNENIHTGDIRGIVSVNNFQAVYTDNNTPCKLTLTFGSDDKIKKAIINVSGDDGDCGGMNVTFNGIYVRTAPKPVFSDESR